MRKESKNFQAETKELLNLMIHSIYTHKEIFLRELISNSSDAMDKLKFNSLTNSDLIINNDELKISLEVNSEKKEISILDNGIGMTYDEVMENIGTIAKSGSKAFMEKLKEKKDADIDIIGQFGVGFYSGFMVADKITLETKSPFGKTGVKWSSTGDGTYEIQEIEMSERGTKITLSLRDNPEDMDFCNKDKIKSLVKKYSDYVKYPIYMENERLNSTKPLWKEKKSDVSKEQYNEFYKSNFHDWNDPIATFHLSVQGSIEYSTLLFIPKEKPYDFYSKDFKRGLQLYTKNIFIMDKCEELIPEYFGFIRGLVDCDTLSLNISREILQKNSELSSISKNLEKKIINELEKILKNNREDYIKFWENFGSSIKYGIQDMFGMNKDKLKDLLIFKSSNNGNYVTLEEYVASMPSTQNEIYYIAGDDSEILALHPKVKSLISKGIHVLFLIDKIDEFSIKVLQSYGEKAFKSVTASDFKLEENQENKEKNRLLEEENKELLDKILDFLKEKVSSVKLTDSLEDAAVSISSIGEISLEMEKTLSEIPGNENIKAEKLLELNPNHSIFKKMQNTTDDNIIKELSEILYTQGMVIQGFTIKNPIDFISKINKYIN